MLFNSVFIPNLIIRHLYSLSKLKFVTLTLVRDPCIPKFTALSLKQLTFEVIFSTSFLVLSTIFTSRINSTIKNICEQNTLMLYKTLFQVPIEL